MNWVSVFSQGLEQFINDIVGPRKYDDVSSLLIIYLEVWCIFLCLLNTAFFLPLYNKKIYPQSGREKCPQKIGVQLGSACPLKLWWLLIFEAKSCIPFPIIAASFIFCFSQQVNISDFRYFLKNNYPMK